MSTLPRLEDLFNDLPLDSEEESTVVPPEPVSPATPPSAGSGEDLPKLDDLFEDTGLRGAQNYGGETWRELGIKLPDNLKKDLGGEDSAIPQAEVEKGMELPTPWNEGKWGHAGKMAFDMVALRDKVADARSGAWTRQFMADNNRAPSPEEFKAKYIELAAEANDEIYALAERTRGGRASALPGSQGVDRRFLWLDTDPQGKLYAGGLGVSTAKQEERGFLSRVFSPFIVNMAGAEHNLLIEDVDEEGKVKPKFIEAPYNESHFLGWLDWLGRESILTYASTAAVAGQSEDPESWATGSGGGALALVNPVNYWRGWGSDEQLRLLSRGEDIVSLREELNLGRLGPLSYLIDGAEAIGLIAPETHSTAQSLHEFATAFGLALVDPDLFSLMTAGTGKVAKSKLLAKIGDSLGTSSRAKVLRRGAAAEEIGDQLANLATSNDDTYSLYGKMDEILRSADPEQGEVALQTARVQVAGDPKASRGTETISGRVRDYKSIEKGRPGGAEVKGSGMAGRVGTENIGRDLASVLGEKTGTLKTAREAQEALLEEGLSDVQKFAKRIANDPSFQKNASPKDRQFYANNTKAVDRELLSLKNTGEVTSGAAKGKRAEEAKKLGDTIEAYKAAQLEDMWASSVFADLKTQKRVVTKLKDMSRASKGTVSLSDEAIKRGLEESAQRVQVARKKMVNAFMETPKPRGKGRGAYPTTAKYVEAKSEHDKAVAQFNTMAMAAATKAGNHAERTLDTLMAGAARTKAKTARKLEAITKNIEKAGKFKVDPSEHKALVKGMVNNAPLALEERALISALAVAYKEQAAAYRKLANFIEETPEARSAFSWTRSGGVSRAAELYRKAHPERADDIMALDAAGDWPVGIKGINTAEEFGEKLKGFKSAREAVEFIAKNAEDASYIEIAKRILDEVPDIPFYLIDETTSREQLEAIAKQTSVNSVNGIMGGGARGMLYSVLEKGFTSKVPQAILIRGAIDADGRNAQTVLHELLHAATTAKIHESRKLQGASKEYKEVFRQLDEINSAVVDAINRKAKDGTLTDIERSWGRNIAGKPDEIVAYGFTNPEFRDFLKTLEMPGEVDQSVWSKFVETIANILGLGVLTPTKAGKVGLERKTALDSLLKAVDDLIDLPAPRAPKDLPTGNLDNLPKDYLSAINKRAGRRGYESVLMDMSGDGPPQSLVKLNFELVKRPGGGRPWEPEYTLTSLMQPGSVEGISKLKKSDSGVYLALYENVLGYLNKIHPEGFSLHGPPSVTTTFGLPQLTKVVNGKIVDEVGESISRMAADVPTTAADARKASDMYTVEQIELHTGWYAKGNKEGSFGRAVRWVQDMMLDMWDPAQKALGPASKEVHQIGVALFGQVRKMQEDLVTAVNPAVKEAGNAAAKAAEEAGGDSKAIERARQEAQSKVVTSYITSSDSINGSLMNTIFGEGRSLWDMAKPMLRAASGTKNLQDAEMAFNALYKMWLPIDTAVNDQIMSTLGTAAKNLLKYGEAFPKLKGKSADELARMRQAGDNISFEEFSDKLKAVTNMPQFKKGDKAKTWGGAGGSDPNLTRANLFAAQAVSQMALINMASTRMNKVLSGVTPESMEAAVRLASGTSLDPSQDMVEAMQALNKLKVPAKIRVEGNKASALLEAGLKMYSDGDGYKAVVPQSWITKTSEQLSNIEKTADAYTIKNPWERTPVETYRGVYRLWHTAILTGLFIPRAAYFVSIYVGNFSQILARQGTAAAARYAKESAQDISLWAPMTLAKQTPLGKYVDASMDYMAAKFPGREFSLASPTNALINKHISELMNPGMADNTRKVIGRGGKEYTMGELRKLAVEQGIFTSFVGAGGLTDLMSRTNPGFGKKMWDQISEGGPLAKRWKDFANTLEQRQRVGLFTDLVVNRGMTPEEAGRITRDALYDWDYPMTAAETFFAKNMFMFYNFTRRAMGQAMRILLDPYIQSPGDTALETVLRSSPALSMLTGKPAYQSANLMAMEKTRRELSEYMADEDTAAEYPWWAKKSANKMFLPNTPMGETRALNYSQTLGRDVDYKVMTMPSFTPVEMANQWGDIVRILGAYGVAWAVDTPAHIIGGARPSQVNFKDDVLLPMLEKMAEQSGPIGEDAIKGIAAGWGEDKQSYLKGGVNVTRLSDRKILEWLESAMGPFVGGLSWEDEQNPGMVRTYPSYLATLRAIPGISNEINTVLGPWLDVSAEGGEVSEVLKETLLNYLNFKTYRYSPEQVRKWDMREIRAKMGVEASEAKRKMPLGTTALPDVPETPEDLGGSEGLGGLPRLDDLFE